MHSGSLFNSQFTVSPGSDGSFVVRIYEPVDNLRREWGFSHITDLIDWLNNHAKILASDKSAGTEI